MMAVRNSSIFTLSGWRAVGVLLTIIITKTLTALVLSYPLAWLANREFAAGGAIRAVFGTDQVSYWHCLGLFAIWHVAHIRIRFSGPAQIEIEGKQ